MVLKIIIIPRHKNLIHIFSFSRMLYNRIVKNISTLKENRINLNVVFKILSLI